MSVTFQQQQKVNCRKPLNVQKEEKNIHIVHAVNVNKRTHLHILEKYWSIDSFIRNLKYNQFNLGRKSNTQGGVYIHRGDSVDIGELSKEEKSTQIGVDKTYNFFRLLT